jgi:hypothetical protein
MWRERRAGGGSGVGRKERGGMREESRNRNGRRGYNTEHRMRKTYVSGIARENFGEAHARAHARACV